MNEEENIQFQIEMLLASLDAPRVHDGANACNNDGKNTFLERHEQRAHAVEQPRPTTDERESVYTNQPQTIIDVYVIQREAEEEPLIIESRLEPVPQESQDAEESEAPIPAQRTRRTSSTKRGMIALVVVVCVLMVEAATRLYLLQLFTPSASVTLVTTARQLTTTSTLQVVTNGTADPTKNQVAGRSLPAITMSEQKTVPTTGTIHQAAHAAHGFVTFYNATPYVQPIEVGTMIAGADGVQVITDQDAIIPEAVMPTEGQTTILGHAVTTGPTGNIRAGDLYGACCRLNVFVTNGAFHGGQDARTYQSVTQQNINGVVSSVKANLDQSVQAAFQTQVHLSETLVTPLSCTSTVTSDHNVGEETTHVQVTVNETCAGMTYNTQAVTTLVTQRTAQDAEKRLGPGYTTTQVHMTQITPSNQNKGMLQVKSVSLWTYPFTQDQQNSIKTMIAGVSKQRATTTLLHLTGVQSVSITPKNGTTLPTDTTRISLLFLQV